MKKQAPTTAMTLASLEQEAYHAYREWPIWLVLRERELMGHLQALEQEETADEAAEKEEKG